ncbi:hypothetical protein BR93DRAFT_388686 [Coniochaeta sp. PMI_546]|nr:hypothetical protein BR93DRAFT_388686 [Coniochaeta sp. PMI_546]
MLYFCMVTWMGNRCMHSWRTDSRMGWQEKGIWAAWPFGLIIPISLLMSELKKWR